jgi:hypothetical protein
LKQQLVQSHLSWLLYLAKKIFCSTRVIARFHVAFG